MMSSSAYRGTDSPARDDCLVCLVPVHLTSLAVSHHHPRRHRRISIHIPHSQHTFKRIICSPHSHDHRGCIGHPTAVHSRLSNVHRRPTRHCRHDLLLADRKSIHRTASSPSPMGSPMFTEGLRRRSERPLPSPRHRHDTTAQLARLVSGDAGRSIPNPPSLEQPKRSDGWVMRDLSDLSTRGVR